VPLLDHLDQTWSQQIILFRRARAMLHGRTEIAGFRQKSYKTLQAMARKTAPFQRKINGMDVVQGELLNGKTAPLILLTFVYRI
jgi:hypothetical protein